MFDIAKLKERKKEYLNEYYILIGGDNTLSNESTLFLSSKGSVKTYSGMDLITETLDFLLQVIIERGLNIKIIVGDNKGTDKCVIDYARLRTYDLTQYEADWDAHGNSAGYKRNEKMFLHLANKPNKASIVFWDGSNRYTLNLIYNAYLFGIPIKVYNYNLKRWLTQDEIRSIQEEEDIKQFQYK